jgi:hypothetical protein
MPEAKSPLITKKQVKEHFKYVWKNRKVKAKSRLRLFKRKLGNKATRPWQHFPYRVVDTRRALTSDSWLSAQDLFLPALIGAEGETYRGTPTTTMRWVDDGIGTTPRLIKTTLIQPQDRGDEPLPRSLTTDEFKRRMGLPARY